MNLIILTKALIFYTYTWPKFPMRLWLFLMPSKYLSALKPHYLKSSEKGGKRLCMILHKLNWNYPTHNQYHQRLLKFDLLQKKSTCIAHCLSPELTVSPLGALNSLFEVSTSTVALILILFFKLGCFKTGFQYQVLIFLYWSSLEGWTLIVFVCFR